MELESSEGDEPMDWEKIPEVRYAKKSKVSESFDIKTNFTFQYSTTPAAPNEVTPTPPQAKKVSPPANSEIIRRKICSKPKVSPPQVSNISDRVILKARPPVLLRL
ncbi:hypothetical protein NPIL_630641 [Nephila pilipes]|uniref:Uncharacterized protein n=1 Tax=Nephila pilipes TaxID=299642 RepID=A0A8X6PXK3_NEPPI|nr:hypothetical protein NPIL_630641 [Nephila pilipes]